MADGVVRLYANSRRHINKEADNIVDSNVPGYAYFSNVFSVEVYFESFDMK